MTSVWAAKQMHASMDQHSASAHDGAKHDGLNALTDAGALANLTKDCHDRGTPSTANCSDAAACIAKCGAALMAVLVAEQAMRFEILRHSWHGATERAPGWIADPPGRPPKSRP